VCGARPKTPKPPMKKPVLLPVPQLEDSHPNCHWPSYCAVGWSSSWWVLGDSCEDHCKKNKMKFNYMTKNSCDDRWLEKGSKSCCCLPSRVEAELKRIEDAK
jgi:hypothetical protein